MRQLYQEDKAVYRKLIATVLLLGAAASASPVWAHHSFAMFDQTQCLKLTGTVKKFEFHNPHVWLWVASEGGNHALELWGFQGGGASVGGRGMTSETFKPGDRVVVVYNPLKDGRHGGSLQQVIRPDGKVLDADEIGDYKACGKGLHFPEDILQYENSLKSSSSTSTKPASDSGAK